MSRQVRQRKERVAKELNDPLAVLLQAMKEYHRDQSEENYDAVKAAIGQMCKDEETAQVMLEQHTKLDDEEDKAAPEPENSDDEYELVKLRPLKKSGKSITKNSRRKPRKQLTS